MRPRFERVVRPSSTVAMVIGLAVSLSAPAGAVAIYTYTGNTFESVGRWPMPPYTTTDRVTATMTLTGPLGPDLSGFDATPNLVALSMSDGHQTLDLTNPGPGVPAIIATFFTDAAGNITGWIARVGTFITVGPTKDVLFFGISTQSFPGSQIIDTVAQTVPPFTSDLDAFVQNDPGVWTLIPEPGTVTLLALGLAAMAGVRRRKMI
jgi:hypothetical protein